MALDVVAPSHRVRAETAAAALDIGVSKTVCLVAPLGLSNPGPGQQFRPLDVIGAGMQGAAGADFDTCARAIRIAADEAESGAETLIHDVAACYSGPGLSSRIALGEARVRGAEVAVRDAQAALSAAIQSVPSPGRCALHVVPLAYSVDGGPATADPRGARGRNLTVEACIVTAPASAVEALRACIRAAILTPREVVAAPYAAALAVVTEEERADGVMVLDMGAGGTGIACLCPEGLAYVGHVPMGGARLTKDLARKLGASFAAAERAKLLHGVVGGHFDPREALEAPKLGRDGRLEAQVVSRADFSDALSPRFQEILLLARAQVMEARMAHHRLPQRAIITGGAAQISGAREIAADTLGMPVRVGRPIGVMEESARAGPAFAAAAGLLRWRLDQPPDAAESHPYEPGLREVGVAACSAASRAWSWLKDNF